MVASILVLTVFLFLVVSQCRCDFPNSDSLGTSIEVDNPVNSFKTRLDDLTQKFQSPITKMEKEPLNFNDHSMTFMNPLTWIPRWTIIETGHVGIVKKWGVIQSTLLPEGFHYLDRGAISKIIPVETRPQTDRVYNVDCVTIEGVQLKFDKIEIENKLPESKVIYTISKFTENYG